MCKKRSARFRTLKNFGESFRILIYAMEMCNILGKDNRWGIKALKKMMMNLERDEKEKLGGSPNPDSSLGRKLGER